MQRELKISFIRYLITIGLLALLNSLWQALEINYYGEIQHRVVDDIISIPIVLSIYLNVKHWLKDGDE